MLSRELTQFPNDRRRNVVILGAGASLAAMPEGDANQRRLPLMADLIDTLKLRSVFDRAGLDTAENFEAAVESLHGRPEGPELVSEIEAKLTAYFSALQLPLQTTLYDRLVLSLRACDTVVTFNWDPLLWDAYLRNRGSAGMPRMLFLHGNGTRQPL